MSSQAISFIRDVVKELDISRVLTKISDQGIENQRLSGMLHLSKFHDNQQNGNPPDELRKVLEAAGFTQVHLDTWQVESGGDRFLVRVKSYPLYPHMHLPSIKQTTAILRLAGWKEDHDNRGRWSSPPTYPPPDGERHVEHTDLKLRDAYQQLVEDERKAEPL